MQYSKIIYNTVFWKTFCELCVWYDHHSERTKSRISREDFPRFSDVFDLLWFIFISLPYIWNSTQKSWIHFHATYFPISPPFWPSFVLNFREASFPTLAIHYSVAAEKKKVFCSDGRAECRVYNIHSLKEQEFPEFKRSSAKFLSRRNLSQKFFDTLFCCSRKEKVFCSDGRGECRV